MQSLQRFAEPHPGEVTALVLRAPAMHCTRPAGGPHLSHASGALLRAIHISDSDGQQRRIQIPVERPLVVCLDGQVAGRLWTLGAAAEWLVLGYLWNQQWVSEVSSLESIAIDWGRGMATVISRRNIQPDRALPPAAARSTGLCGALGTDEGGLLASLDSIELPSVARASITPGKLLSLLEKVPRDGAMYRVAGSVHGCALFRADELWISVEDVSRRNAFDTITGWMALHAVSGDDKILFTTGRFTAEIVIKAALSGIPIIVSRKGVTNACFELATRLGVTLIGHAGNGHFICYAGAERLAADS